MAPEQIGDATLYLGDCLSVMAGIPDASIDLIVADPPYWSTGKASVGDKGWRTADAFLAWLDSVVAEMARVLRPNGSLYLFCFADMSDRVSVTTRRHLNVLNHIVWMKAQGWHNKAEKEALRSYLSPTERIIFAEHYGSDSTAMGGAGYDAKCDELRGFVFEPLRSYLDEERKRAGFDSDMVRKAVGCAPGSGLPSHWFTRSQWMLPTEGNYAKLRAAFNAPNLDDYLRRDYEDLRRDYEDLRRDYDYLRRDYEDLRRDYEDLRRPFTVSADVPYTDVWDFRTVAHYPGKHPCEKPAAMIAHIVKASSREGGVVLDPFMGSGVTGSVCAAHNRRFVGIEIAPHYYDRAIARLSAPRQTRLAEGA